MTTIPREGVGLAAAWRLVSLGLTPPSEETLAEVETLAEALMDVSPSPEIAGVLDAVRNVEASEAAAQYAALFRGKVLVAPYEGSYELDPLRQGRQMADVAAFYRAFGAEANGPGAERPDFAGCELEFLAFLELRRLLAVEADEDGVDVLDEISGSFLTEHAGRWLPTFFGDVLAAADAPLYRALAWFGAATLAAELERRDLRPVLLPRRRAQSAVEADTLECGASGAVPAL